MKALHYASLSNRFALALPHLHMKGHPHLDMFVNTRTLIRTLQNATIDERYSNIEVVNRDPSSGSPRDGDRGSFSVIFRAFDSTTRQHVAIKFFDPSQQGFGANYRMTLFSREVDILQRLCGKRRCLQLIQPLSEMVISVDDSEGNVVEVTCGYFVMEWLDDSIEAYFVNHQAYDALVKLALFRSMVLGVFALHREDIAHRDLKYDNLMLARRQDDELVVPIDLGTAIDLTSEPIGGAEDYAQPVGAWLFAPIEAQCGLAHLRELSVYTDIYALGCMLHDLFNTDFYFVRLCEDPGFLRCFAACRLRVAQLLSDGGANEDRLLKHWDELIRLTGNQVTPSIATEGTSAPNAAQDQLDRLTHRLTSLRYLNRLRDLNTILRMVASASRAIANQLADQRRRTVRLAHRQRREQRRIENLARLEHVQQEALSDA